MFGDIGLHREKVVESSREFKVVMKDRVDDIVSMNFVERHPILLYNSGGYIIDKIVSAMLVDIVNIFFSATGGGYEDR